MTKNWTERIEKLEDTLTIHLIESGEIRGDLKWLKRGYWVIFASLLAILARVLYK